MIPKKYFRPLYSVDDSEFNALNQIREIRRSATCPDITRRRFLFAVSGVTLAATIPALSYTLQNLSNSAWIPFSSNHELSQRSGKPLLKLSEVNV